MPGKRPPSSRFKGSWAEFMCQAFCIVLYLLELFDSLVLEDCSEQEQVGDEA